MGKVEPTAADWSLAMELAQAGVTKDIAWAIATARAEGRAEERRDVVAWANSGAAPAFAEQAMAHVELGEHVGYAKGMGADE